MLTVGKLTDADRSNTCHSVNKVSGCQTRQCAPLSNVDSYPGVSDRAGAANDDEGAAQHNGASRTSCSAAITRQPSSLVKPPGTRKLLVILHGKRIDDDQIRDAITTLKKEGHQV